MHSVLNVGVKCLDITATYGDSEVVIGKWLKTIQEKLLQPNIMSATISGTSKYKVILWLS